MGRLLLLCLLALPLTTSAQETKKDTVKHESLGQKLLKPIKWIGRNWSACDPAYSVPSFYDWAVQLQNTTSFEWVNIETPQGVDLSMRSKVSNRVGPYLGYSFLFYGYTIDLNTIGKPKGKGKNEFTLSINSNLMNIDLIRRRTGGDFIVRRLNFTDPADPAETYEFSDLFADENLGDYAKNSLTGINLNIFTNHRKYSNPAAFSNGAVQLRPAGSPMIGLGYTHQKVETQSADLFGSVGMLLLTDENGFPLLLDEELMERIDYLYDNDREAFNKEFGKMLEKGWKQMIPIEKTFITNLVPTTTTIDDWHLQLGYAYNLVFSRRLLLGLSAVVSPGIKRVKSNNIGSLTYDMAEELSRLTNLYDGKQTTANDFRYDFRDTHFNVNTFLRASLTFNFNRWRAGFYGTFSNYYYNHNNMKVNNSFGNITAYVGYCFGRRKEYRHGGEKRQDYIMAALTKKDIEEMKDTMPEGNLHRGSDYIATEGRTRNYHSDEFTLNIQGCDLVCGPEGKYGWIDIEDGYITPGEDTEGRLSKGKRIEIGKDGSFKCEAGHSSSFRAGNWWKSQVSIDQVPNNWYPEMLHYALRGKLTLYLRGRIFGTKKPVKMVLDDFCLNHGSETQSFSQVALKSFVSNAPYSIEGRTEVNGRECRVYIEQKNRGKQTNLYLSRIYSSNANWMSTIDGERPISSLSIPGTHNAGTAALNESPIVSATQTQLFSVADQLSDGIRAFDLKLKDNLSYGSNQNDEETFEGTLKAWDKFLGEHPTECIVALIGNEKKEKWSETMAAHFRALMNKYQGRVVQHFEASTPLDRVRGKILVIRKEENCPFGKLLKFTDNAVFDYDCFHVENVYKEHKTWKKTKLIEQNIRDAYENEDPNKWFITFSAIAWSPRRHTPYSYAWGGKAKNIRKPVNPTFREFVELKDYTDFGIVFLDFYNNHGENPQVVETIIGSNYHREDE